MLLTKSNFENHVCSDGNGRYALDHLLITPKGVVSTDGHRLMRTPLPDQAVEVPVIKGLDASQPAPDKAMVPASAASDIAKLPDTKSYTPACHLIQAEFKGFATFGGTNLARSRTVGNIRYTEEEVGYYPDYESVLSRKRAKVAVTLNIKDTIHLLQQVHKAAGSANAVVTIGIVDSHTGIWLKTESGDVVAFLMPIGPIDDSKEAPSQSAAEVFGV